jgi:hypothetical protein
MMTTPYKTVPAYSVKFIDGQQVERETTSPDFLCMDYDTALHALRAQHDACVDMLTWAAVKTALEALQAVQP